LGTRPALTNLYIVIPAFNEDLTIGKLVGQVRDLTDNVIVVNDNSSDRTSASARDAGAKVIDLPINMGAGYATRVGCDEALRLQADIIVTIDADGQHDPLDIPVVLQRINDNDGVEVIFGCRPRTGTMPITKRIGNALLTRLAKLLFGAKVSDSQTGFHVFTANGYRKSRWEANRYGFVSEIVFRVTKNRVLHAEIPIKTIYTGKTTGMGFIDGLASIRLMLSWKWKYG